jgi:L-threonylcarbamoyladenylate synthase
VIVDGRAESSIALAVLALRAGEPVGMPTETVYGLAADAENSSAVAKVFALKGRPAEHPLIVHLAGAADATHFADQVPAFARVLMERLWPGPLTLILRRRPAVAGQAAGGQDSIGLRCPSHPVAQALLKACAQAGVKGLAAPSANLFGRISPTAAAHVLAELGPDLLVLDGGACEVGIESTIVDCTRARPVLLRPGAIGRATIEKTCGQALAEEHELAQGAGQAGGSSPAGTQAAPRASGTLQTHYAPRAKLRLMDAKSLQRALHLLGDDIDAANKAQAPGVPGLAGQGKATIAVYSRAVLASRSATIIRRRMPDDAGETAKQLFAVLRGFDEQGVKLIWVETPPDEPEWEGVLDRLRRAAAS